MPASWSKTSTRHTCSTRRETSLPCTRRSPQSTRRPGRSPTPRPGRATEELRPAPSRPRARSHRPSPFPTSPSWCGSCARSTTRRPRPPVTLRPSMHSRARLRPLRCSCTQAEVTGWWRASTGCVTRRCERTTSNQHHDQ